MKRPSTPITLAKRTRRDLVQFILNNEDDMETLKDWASSYLNGLPTSILEEEAAKHTTEAEQA